MHEHGTCKSLSFLSRLILFLLIVGAEILKKEWQKLILGSEAVM